MIYYTVCIMQLNTCAKRYFFDFTVGFSEVYVAVCGSFNVGLSIL